MTPDSRSSRPPVRAQADSVALARGPTMNLAPKSDAPRDEEETPGWEAVTAFVEWEQALPSGTYLRDYVIRSVIGESDFDIVYTAWDESLRRRVAIKEYLPRTLAARVRGTPAVELKHGASAAAFEVGLKGFVAEARMLARFDHAALVKVYRFWEENGTAYRVMPHVEGPTLEKVLADRPQEEAEVRAWLRPVLDAVSVMHAARCFHHHIGPDNIVLTGAGAVLLDFAAARRLIGSLAEGPAAVVKPGYAGIELYSEAATLAPGPWTDLYALAAVAYRAVSGAPPPPAPQRLADDRLKPLAELAAGRCSEGFVRAIDAALALQPENRPHDDAEFRDLIGGMEPPLPPIPIGSPRDLMSEPFFQDASATREVTVPIPTQPYPAPVAEALHPMDEPFVPAHTPPPPPEPLPFAREETGLSRRVMFAIAGGVCVLGAVAAFVLYSYAGRTPTVEPLAPAASAAVGEVAQPPRKAPPPAPLAAKPDLAPAPEAPPASRLDAPTASPNAARSVPVEAPPVNEAERRTRCGDLLQEATLRRLTVAEAAFFKKECR